MLCSRTPPWLKALVRSSAECRPARKPAPLPVRSREIRASSEESVGNRYVRMAAGNSARVAGEPDGRRAQVPRFLTVISAKFRETYSCAKVRRRYGVSEDLNVRGWVGHAFGSTSHICETSRLRA